MQPVILEISTDYIGLWCYLCNVRGAAIRMRHWKAVRPKRGGSWQLFDLEADGTETVDLAERQPEQKKEPEAQFETWRKRVGAQ